MNKTLRQSRSPLYVQIAGILRQNLERGVWKTGQLLPTTSTLSEGYSVAKITIRQALKILEEEGLLQSHRGRGTTVLPPPPARDRLHLGNELSALVDMYRGDKPALDLLEDRDSEVPGELTIGKCHNEAAGLLNLAVGDPVVEVRRILCDADDRMISLADITYRSGFVRLEMDLLA